MSCGPLCWTLSCTINVHLSRTNPCLSTLQFLSNKHPRIPKKLSWGHWRLKHSSLADLSAISIPTWLLTQCKMITFSKSNSRVIFLISLTNYNDGVSIRCSCRLQLFAMLSMHSLNQWRWSISIDFSDLGYGSFHVRSPRQKPLPFLIFLKIAKLIDLSKKIRLWLVPAL